MNAQLKLAYDIGAATAKEDFDKVAAGEIATPVLGGIPGWAGPLLSGAASGVTAPKGEGLAAGGRAAAGSLLGQLGGGLGGAALGGGTGYGIGHLIKALGGKADPERAARIGAILGGVGGMVGGGAYGAHRGRKAALEEPETKESSAKTARAPSDASDVTSAALGGIPVLGPAAAGLASGMSGPRGLRQTTGMATTGGSAAGQALGGLGGAAVGAGLGAGGAALYNALKRDPTLWERITGGGPQDVDIGKATGIGAAIGGGLGTIGGGILGAHKGRGYGEERAERRDAIKAQIIEHMRQRAAARAAQARQREAAQSRMMQYYQ